VSPEAEKFGKRARVIGRLTIDSRSSRLKGMKLKR